MVFKKLIDSIERGVGIGIGLVIVATLFLGVYAFVEPTSGPSADYYINPNSSGANNNNFFGVNKVPSGTFPDDYTEVCFKEGTTLYDTHSGGESTSGGNCEPGDTGFVIEQDRNGGAVFNDAVEGCLQKGMRLQTVFEYSHSCDNAGSMSFTTYDIVVGTGNLEWADGNGLVATHGSRAQTRLPDIGYRSAGGGCRYSSNDIYMTGSSPNSRQYRCAK